MHVPAKGELVIWVLVVWDNVDQRAKERTVILQSIHEIPIHSTNEPVYVKWRFFFFLGGGFFAFDKSWIQTSNGTCKMTNRLRWTSFLYQLELCSTYYFGRKGGRWRKNVGFVCFMCQVNGKIQLGRAESLRHDSDQKFPFCTKVSWLFLMLLV